LTDQLLTLSREDAGVAQRAHAAVDIAALTRGVAETMRPLAEEKGVRIQVAGPGSLQIDADGPRLRQVHYNLIDNAIKYSSAGDEVDGKKGDAARFAGRSSIRRIELRPLSSLCWTCSPCHCSAAAGRQSSR
jgi:signal transduction histidine kinase